MVRPDESENPYQFFAYGASCGMVSILLLSDLIFKQRMCFAPVFILVTLNILYSICMFCICFKYPHGFKKTTREWLLFTDSFFSQTVCFYSFYMAPI